MKLARKFCICSEAGENGKFKHSRKPHVYRAQNPAMERVIAVCKNHKDNYIHAGWKVWRDKP